MVNMEISINIKLEDADIGLLIKSLFELIKKLPQDNVEVKVDQNVKPPNTATDDVHTNTNPNTDISSIPAVSEDDVFYSNGSSVKKINSEKKNEEF